MRDGFIRKKVQKVVSKTGVQISGASPARKKPGIITRQAGHLRPKT